MRAAVYYGQEDVRVEDIEEPEGPAANEVRVAVEACGICGSDLHEYTAGPIFIPDEGEPNPVTGEELPIPMGHEFAGEVTEVGEGVSNISVGDHVAVNPIIYCDECQHCEAGNYHLCESGGFIGLSGGGGGLSEEVVVPEEKAITLPDSIPTEYGALVEPFSVGFHAVQTSDFSAGDSVAVYGTGPIGLTVIQVLQAAGAGTIYGVEPQDSRRHLASEVGADKTINPIETDAAEYITEQTDGGVDVAFEAAGIEQTVQDAIASTAPSGNITIVSIFEETVELNPNEFVMGERTLSGTLAYEGGPQSDEEFGAVIGMFESENLDPEALISSRIKLENVVEDGFEALLSPEQEAVKILVEL
ncbi:(R,R)-butanediol dehydrogenase/meso-butanediol dehydrogenase/diacetyl reductase [Natrinema hispanicum]|mgnify:CR=1 FL=1|uniref:(R,R)-butanediol dehydrogenase/meso-butanediol dehydrogenase/diacetyl reductase n=1 Tax=Natrinema hispanicum TaxID=392421 RepID=A0A482Y3X0_9EURY|nr:2,3-butanediol dehydrogenase [Natrinema hispanicum]RZV06203.1 (R,R)-butanediol dehydrogenase/meso-butanediol dehydrogenase/diacetyl reductase [Natrinema hispanicum]